MQRVVPRLLYWMPAAGIMALLAYSSHQPRWPAPLRGYPDWLLHGAAYAILAGACVYGAGAGRLREASTWTLLAGAAIASLYGALDEWHQGLIAGRSAALSDWIADSLGALTAVAALRLGSFAGPGGLWEDQD